MANKKNDSQPHSPQPQAAYLIRCWREAERWRYSVEDVASRRQRRYDSVEALLKGIEVQLLDNDLAPRSS